MSRISSRRAGRVGTCAREISYVILTLRASPRTGRHNIMMKLTSQFRGRLVSPELLLASFAVFLRILLVVAEAQVQPKYG